MNTNIQDGDRHLRPLAYYALALLDERAGCASSYGPDGVTIACGAARRAGFSDSFLAKLQD